VLFALAYLAYEGARALSRGTDATAMADAHRVLGAERALGLAVEGPIQRAFLGTPWLDALDWVYLAAQSVALVAALIVVYRASRSVYRLLRTTLLTTWLLALPVYALFPTAPPRLAAPDLADTVSAHTPIGLGSASTTLFYNPYAAVPSLHAGFAVALGIAVAVSARSQALRILGLVWGPLVILAVLATANHFLLDVAAGLLLSAAGLVLALRLERRAPGGNDLMRGDGMRDQERRLRADLADAPGVVTSGPRPG
jgi:membrane-associated phospholipid phosphatase